MSVRSGRGKHTTRHVSLLPLSDGGYLADTPGFNQPSLIKVTKNSLAHHFPEVCPDGAASFSKFCVFVAQYVNQTIYANFISNFQSDYFEFRFAKCLTMANLQSVHSTIACILVNRGAL